MTNVILATITAYCHCTICTPGSGVCADRKPPRAGYTIAGPRHLPLGSRVEIAGHTYTLQDRTAKRFDGRFDIYFADHAAAKRFGRQTNTVTIITP